jgi:hypothetical protein
MYPVRTHPVFTSVRAQTTFADLLPWQEAPTFASPRLIFLLIRNLAHKINVLFHFCELQHPYLGLVVKQQTTR